MLLFILLILLLALLLLAGKRFSTPAAYGQNSLSKNELFSGELIVGTYNIHRARGLDGQQDLSRTAEVLRGADIVGISEVQGWANLKRENQLLLLARKLNLTGLFCPTQFRWLHQDRGNGILSRFNITQWYREPLADSTGKHARCLCRADIQLGELIVPVFSTHLARRTDQEIQLNTVFDRFMNHDTAILMGDFNVAADFPLLKSLIEKSGAQDALITLNQTDRIDWILCKGFDVLDAGMNDSSASDHPYYWCRLRLTQK
ncbi:MAG: endonuclease/exonuclease/phosphatase family protein [Arenicellales bacterium]